jgi:glycosyltransferase involved in cell wall biosynthesis
VNRKIGAASPPLREIITGRPRPRHLRFAEALAELVPGRLLERRDLSLRQRVQTNAVCLLTGVRRVSVPGDGAPVVLHQGLAATDTPYAVEFDVPLAVHGYRYQAYLRHADKARRLMENPALRIIFVFSEWAKRSFAAHFGEETAAKCRVSYPLAFSQARFGSGSRRYDFTFISTQFQIKGGPELLRAFRAVRQSGAPEAKLCMVTNLREAMRLVGDIAAFPGVEWRDANLDQASIAHLLSDSHCLVHPSLSDSFGVVVMEALAAGCALITTDMASFPELVAHGSGQMLTMPIGQVVGDVSIPEFGNARAFARLLDRLSLRRLEDGLTEAMSRMVADSDGRTRHQEAARALYISRFSREAWKTRMREDMRTAFPELGL